MALLVLDIQHNDGVSPHTLIKYWDSVLQFYFVRKYPYRDPSLVGLSKNRTTPGIISGGIEVERGPSITDAENTSVLTDNIVSVENNTGGNGSTGNTGNGTAANPISVSFSIASTPWIINHNLGYVPRVTVTDNQGNELAIEKKVTNNQIIITPNQPSIGRVTYS